VNLNSPKSVEVMLSMLIAMSEEVFSKFLTKHFAWLFETGLSSFETYLGSCFF
jgi:hypothetical protein